MGTAYTPEPQMVALGLLIARLVIGLMMAAHGAQKLFGWFGGYGLHQTGEFFVQLGFPPGRLFATLASLGEGTSGLLIALGFLGPVGPALMISVMIVAAISVHLPNGLFAATNGIEIPLLYSTVAFGLALAGPGPYSVDAMLGIASAWTPRTTWIVLAIGALGGIANLLIRRRSAAAGSA